MGSGVVLAHSPRRRSWGFCTTRSCAAACHRRVGPSCSAIPPNNGVQAMTHVGPAHKTQTASPKSGEIGRLREKRLAFWVQRSLAGVLLAGEATALCANPMGRVLTRDIAR